MSPASNRGSVQLSNAEHRQIEILHAHAEELQSEVQPGERCPTCHRRVNRKRTTDSPPVKEVRFRAPADVIEAIEEQFDMLQEYTGLDPYGFPRARLLEALTVLGIQQREELAARFRNKEEAWHQSHQER